MTHKNKHEQTFRAWLPYAIIIVVLTGLISVAVQQDYRMSANDPQIQISQDVVTAINQGKADPASIVPPNPTSDMSQSLAPFVLIYSGAGAPIGGSVALDGKVPNVPAGALDAAKSKGENRFTWEPKSGVRIAAVVSYFSGKTPGFVLAGRSLKEVEVREKNLMMISTMAALLALILVYLALFFMGREVHYRATEATLEIFTEEKV